VYRISSITQHISFYHEVILSVDFSRAQLNEKEVLHRVREGASGTFRLRGR